MPASNACLNERVFGTELVNLAGYQSQLLVNPQVKACCRCLVFSGAGSLCHHFRDRNNAVRLVCAKSAVYSQWLRNH